MPIKCLVPSKSQIDELRKAFQDKYAVFSQTAEFHPIDLERINGHDLWLTRFLEMYDLDFKTAFQKLWETCKWRKDFGANDLNEKNVRDDYLRDGVIFSHNRDVDGKPLLIFKVKLHTKGSKDMDEVIRVVVYWVERLQRQSYLEKLTVMFDMAGTGLANMDIEFITRIIDTFKMYYPNCLNYILVYEMSWVLNAAFKIIKGLLPPKALEILKLITKKDISTYIDKNNCLVAWGGNDSYEFSFEAEDRSEQQQSLKVNDPHSIAHDKKVHFANSSPVRETQMKDFDDHHMAAPPDHKMLRISPKEFISFATDDGKESIVEIQCISKYPVIFKIQTTSPEKFRVRPRCGILKPDERTFVNILLKPEHRLQEGAKDKFLVMCMEAPRDVEMTPQQISESWKQKPSNSPDVEQHRLCCVYKGSEGLWENGGVGEQADSKTTSIKDLLEHAQKTKSQLHKIQILQYVTLFLLLLVVVYLSYLVKTKSLVEEGEVVTHSPEQVKARSTYERDL